MKVSIFNILVFDQVVLNAYGIKSIFKEVINIEVISVLNFREAKEVLSSVKVDIVFFEINNKGNLDFTSVLKMKEIQPDIKIIIFTDYDKIDEINSLVNRVEKCSVIRKSASMKEIFYSISS